ncbi:site-specific DNA-methyltransferase [bacterium]|nr:site-specific DNA-methyltransferase [bacterium]
MDEAIGKENIFYEDRDFKLLKGDTFHLLSMFPKGCIDMIFADPPYFLSSGGISCSGGKQVSVDKGDWDKSKSILERIEYHRSWIAKCRDVLKDDGTIWISSTFHSVYAIGVALELEGFSIINNIIWQKTNPAPNLACRSFTHSTETILWARKIMNGKKGKYTFNYEAMKEENHGKQMKDVWNFEEEGLIISLSTTPKSEKKLGNHPTQKPLKLLERIILSSSKENDLILDPFCGSGTTGIAAFRYGRRFVGIDMDEQYLDLSQKRYEVENNAKKF